VADQLYLRVKNWLLEGAMAQAQLAILPTQYQAASFPEAWQHKIQVIHEGVDPQLCAAPRLESLCLGPGITLEPGVPVVTFISRNLEPMRGFPTFMEALPELQRQHATVQVVVVGGDEVSYSQTGPDGRSWREVMLEKLNGQLDLDRLHFFPRIPHAELIKLYRRSDLHVYLSRPFVLSWSLIEVMACATPILASQNAMSAEVITPGEHGGLCSDHPQALASALVEGLKDPERLRRWGENARRRVEAHYLRPACLETLIGLIEPLSQGCF
jgi:glycosyltransferase involved in cell wall biosynthesis